MSDELKPCPNRECKGGPTSMQRATTKHRISFRRVCRCGVSGPSAAWPEAADDLWNALPRDEPAGDAREGEATRLLRRLAAVEPWAESSMTGYVECIYCDADKALDAAHRDDCPWAAAEKLVEAAAGRADA